MGGPLSGRWGGRPTVEACGSIVIALGELIAMGKGRPVFGATYSGHVGGNPYRIGVGANFGPGEAGSLTISHAAFDHLTSPVRAGFYTVELVTVPWQFGGRRWFMLCPRSGRRVLKLYLPDGAQRFAGRASLGLDYHVQRLDPVQRGHARLTRAYAKLGTPYEHLNQPIPPRPKWMRVATYDRLVGQLEDVASRHRSVCNSSSALGWAKPPLLTEERHA